MYDVRTLTLEEKIGQLLMASLDGMTLDAAAEAFLAENHIGNIVHFGNNVRDPEQASALNASLRASIEARVGIPPLIAIDHEGGRVVRFQSGATVFPPPMAIGATGDPALAEMVGRAMGEELAGMGFHINIAPSLDVNTNPENPVIGVRSFGDRPERVAAMGIRMAQGMQSTGLIACGKHFPGHGDTAVDSHYGLPCVDKPLEALEREELFPFSQAVREGIGAIMTSHILYPALEPQDVPATMSHDVLYGLLRGRMGFDGLIISDGMHMRAITERFGVERGCVEAIKAGCDLLCIGTGGAGWMASQAGCYRALLQAARTGELPVARVNDAVRRILRVKEAHYVPFMVNVDWAANARLAQHVAERSVTWLWGGRQPVKGRVLCVSMPMAPTRYGVTEGNWRNKPFADLAAEALGGASLLLDDGPGWEAELDAADTVVAGVSQGMEKELAFVKAALGRGKRTIAVLTGLPYVAGKLPEGCEAVCAYSAVPVSAKAVCRVLRGEVEPRGMLPVRM